MRGKRGRIESMVITRAGFLGHEEEIAPVVTILHTGLDVDKVRRLEELLPGSRRYGAVIPAIRVAKPLWKRAEDAVEPYASRILGPASSIELDGEQTASGDKQIVERGKTCP
jgi:hypothetical protein